MLLGDDGSRHIAQLGPCHVAIVEELNRRFGGQVEVPSMAREGSLERQYLESLMLRGRDREDLAEKARAEVRNEAVGCCTSRQR